MSIVTNNIMSNLQSMGILKDKDESILAYTMNRDYSILLERKKTTIWNEENSFKYFCKFIILNSMNIPVLELITNEQDIFRMFDSIFSYLEFGMTDSYIYLNPNNTNLIQNVIGIKRINNEKEIDEMTIYNYNPMNQYMIPRLKLLFDKDSLNDFLDKIYYTFLINYY